MRIRSTILAVLLLCAVMADEYAGLSGAASGPAGSAAVAVVGEQRFREVTGVAGQRVSAGGSVSQGPVRVASGESIVSIEQGIVTASAAARSVDVLDGAVAAYGVRRKLTADEGGRRYEGAVRGLRIDGVFVGDVTRPKRYELSGGRGTVHVNRGGSGIRVVGSDGTVIQVAFVSGRVPAPRPPAPTPTTAPTATPDAPRGDEDPAETKKPKKPSAADREKARERRHIDRLSALELRFPVIGYTQFPDTYGATRVKIRKKSQKVVGHAGIDVFGPLGAPVVAVDDGVVELVGTLPQSGNRLWLRTKTDAYFYAHLASFAPAARNGARVRAGTVLGYTGNTGDAEPTPPHVHFEIHPGTRERPPVDPFPILQAWSKSDPQAAVRSARSDARPGALVEVRDFIAGE